MKQVVSWKAAGNARAGKARHIAVALLAILFLCTFPAACAHGEEPDNAKFVADVLRMPGLWENAKLPEDLYVRDPQQVLAGTDEQMAKLASKPIYDPLFYLTDISTVADPSDPTLVTYSCKIPGAMGIAFNMFDNSFHIQNDTLSPRMEMSGTLKVVTDETGQRRVDISGANNPISLYINLRYADENTITLIRTLIYPDQTSNDINVMLSFVAVNYMMALDRPDFMSSVMSPEINVLMLNPRTYLTAKQPRSSIVFETKISSNAWRVMGLKCIPLVPQNAGIAQFFVYGALFAGTIFAISKLNAHIKKRKQEKERKVKEALRAAETAQRVQNGCHTLDAFMKEDKPVWSTVPIKLDDADALYALYHSDEASYHKLISAAKDISYNAKDEKRDANLESYFITARDILKADEKTTNRIRADEVIASLEKLLVGFDNQLHAAGINQDATVMELESALYSMRKQSPVAHKYLMDAANKACEEATDMESLNIQVPPADVGRLDTVKRLVNASDNVEVRVQTEQKAEELRQAKEELTQAVASAEERYLAVLGAEKDRTESYNRYTEGIKTADLTTKTAQSLLDEISKARKHLVTSETKLMDARINVENQIRNVNKKIKDYDNPISKSMEAYQATLLSTPAMHANLPACEESTDSPDILETLILQAYEPAAVLLSDEELGRLLQNKKSDIAGWAACAIGRRACRQMTAAKVEKNRKQLEEVFDEYQREMKPVIEAGKKVTEALKNYRSIRVTHLESESKAAEILENAHNRYLELLNAVEQSIAVRLANKGYSCFMYLFHMLADSSRDLDRFVKQGVIMGVLEFLSLHQNEATFKPLFDTILNVRKGLISDDQQMSFFQVRVPSNCTPKLYAVLLKDTLKVANPSLPYCDTDKLIDIILEEVPDAMQLFRDYPLRLIDPVNEQTQGFYEFKPYILAGWVQYQPPLNVGQVIRRFHEVQDRTLPLSTGINLRLFTDCYSVIPTIFHEYTHYSGDRNEASVFLKTQMFSIAFYRRHKESKPAQDNVFTTLMNLLGRNPSSEKLDALNGLIEKYYGKMIPKAEAEVLANSTLAQINFSVTLSNRAEKWCPDVRMPLLLTGKDDKSKEGDRENGQLLHDVIVRYWQTPKSITKDEFDAIVS